MDALEGEMNYEWIRFDYVASYEGVITGGGILRRAEVESVDMHIAKNGVRLVCVCLHGSSLYVANSSFDEVLSKLGIEAKS